MSCLPATPTPAAQLLFFLDETSNIRMQTRRYAHDVQLDVVTNPTLYQGVYAPYFEAAPPAYLALEVHSTWLPAQGINLFPNGPPPGKPTALPVQPLQDRAVLQHALETRRVHMGGFVKDPAVAEVWRQFLHMYPDEDADLLPEERASFKLPKPATQGAILHVSNLAFP